MDQNQQQEIRAVVVAVLHEYGLDDPTATRTIIDRAARRQAFMDKFWLTFWLSAAGVAFMLLYGWVSNLVKYAASIGQK